MSITLICKNPSRTLVLIQYLWAQGCLVLAQGNKVSYVSKAVVYKDKIRMEATNIIRHGHVKSPIQIEAEHAANQFIGDWEDD